ncbi:hypothetical protein SULI_14890 [Saccharolobus solfataricus]|uniref:Uncharacterized protein n=1 Tax=Saccharolobus solfataricus TaxID=2287 RepID=A0A0E3KDS8_SACSO|nr:hypothetical protein SULB_2916 [Saccharolobus solfataricus]AKA77661.1 hypothetical protein SULC_2913 [Saccharolobus solfataricus]AKA80352.1 hypothetical protein SULA_2916 [Saccharolobus solfataricus]AZF69430.1 hypothetical protein SULG_14890 [Saccharolobus solfataricus]AZF72050.1 hypothetical protein SULH_14890 [Saccharolobus solfataricus]
METLNFKFINYFCTILYMDNLIKALLILNLILSLTLSELFVIPLVLLTAKFILSSAKRD